MAFIHHILEKVTCANFCSVTICNSQHRVMKVIIFF